MQLLMWVGPAPAAREETSNKMALVSEILTGGEWQSCEDKVSITAWMSKKTTNVKPQYPDPSQKHSHCP